MTAPTDPMYSSDLLRALRDSLEAAQVIDPRARPLDDEFTTDGDLVALLDALRADGYIVQPAPVPGIPVNALPDGPPAPGAPADPGTPIDGPNW